MRFLTLPIFYTLLTIAGIALLFGGVQSYRLSRLQTKSLVCMTDRANFAATQQNNLAVIADLSRRLAVQAEARKVEKAAAGKALLALDKEAMAADARNAELAGQLESLYAKDGGARAWGTQGVDAGVAARLPR